MRKIFIPLFLLLVTAIPALSQNQYEVLPDQTEGKLYKGIISRDLLEKDTSFKWYANGLAGYHVNTDAVDALKKNRDSIQFITFMGTWCEDSHFVIPKFFYLLDAAGFPGDRVSLIGVDRGKKTLSHLTEAMGIINVPTIIVMKNGKELGRVVEYGKSGIFDKDLAEIINSTGSTTRN
jgi:thiol-disulfide isomerase/thioredoxin